MRIDSSAAVYVISVAAELAGMHPQTLRQYDKLGLVTPKRTPGRGRRYSADDIRQLQEVQRLSQDEGINLAGIKEIIELRRQVRELTRKNELLAAEAEQARQIVNASRRVFAAGTGGEIITLAQGKRPRGLRSTALVRWQPRL